jgi:glycosyltransferase involved in cell wall biosynthesis
MTPRPLLTVIVPAYNAATMLHDVLGALRASALDPAEWELIVVDDGSTDGTCAAGAQYADSVVALPAPPGGPGRARNAGAAQARGAWLVFIDADVRVHQDTLSRIREVATSREDVVAVFGAYDDRPEAKGVVSQFRNLLHRYVHLQGAGEAATFWAGCGAVRREAFLELGGFDTARFRRPQIEDIDLGYRLRDRGGRILLDPTIQGTHLKRWDFRSMVRTDIRDRGIPWMRLLLERRGRPSTALNTGRLEQGKVALTGVAMLLLPLGLALGAPGLLAASGIATAAVVVANWPAHLWYAQLRGRGFAALSVPLLLIHYASGAVAAGSGVLVHALRSLQGRGTP